LFSLAFFTLTYFSALAQVPKPSWVDDLNGTSGYSEVLGLSVDKQNNIYITGEFQGTIDFDPSAGVKNVTSVGGCDIFVGKYHQDGSLIWVKSMGSTGNDIGNGIAVDKDGNVSIVGVFNSALLDADPGPGSYYLYNPNSPNSTATFMIHLDTNGNFLWANSSTNKEEGEYVQVATDSQDNVVATASFIGTFTIGDSMYTGNTKQAGLIVKYNSIGNVSWVIPLLGPEGTIPSLLAWGITVDSQDNVVASGILDGTINFNPLGAVDNVTVSNFGACFVAKYSSSGALTWVNTINSTITVGGDSPLVCSDGQNNICFSTAFVGSLIFGSVTATATGDNPNVCIAKYSSAGLLLFAKSIAPLGVFDYNSPITNDKNGNIYLAGYFNNSVNFNPELVPDATLSAHGSSDFYIAKYDPTGNYLYAFNGGSANCSNTIGSCIAIDSDNNVNLGGSFCSTVNFDPSGCSPETLTASSGSDPFITQYGFSVITNDVITVPTISSFCVSGTPGAISGTVPSGGSGTYTYQWQSSTDSISFVNITGATGQNYTPPTLLATTYFQRIVTATSCAAPGVSNVVSLTITPSPAAPVVPAATTCVGSTATFSVTSPQVGYTYYWYTSPTGDSAVFTGNNFITPSLSDSVTYYVAAANSNGCNSLTRSAITATIVQPLSIPTVRVGPATASTIVFEWSAVPGAIGYQVSTDNGQNYFAVAGLTDTISGLQAGQSVTILVEATGVVPCQLSAASTAVTGLAISPTDDIIYVPNVFTPNGDGTNDVVHVHGINIKSVNFHIYDQWGELIFSSTNAQNGWDGTFRGAREPIGVYVYLVEAVMNDGRSVTKKGTVTLIR
jgi:gliding motility-associated-like protein